MKCFINKHVSQLHIIIPISQVEILRRGADETHLPEVTLNSHVLKFFEKSDGKGFIKDWDGRHGK